MRQKKGIKSVTVDMDKIEDVGIDGVKTKKIKSHAQCPYF